MILTAFLSGMFGMAGGLILIGVLLVVLPLPTGHGAACGDPDGLQRLARHPVVAAHRVEDHGLLASSAACVVGRPVVALALRARQGGGAAAARPLALHRAGDPRQRAAAQLRPGQMLGGSAICMMLMLLAGVTGPLARHLFLRSTAGARQIIATKAACQLFSHSFKLVYFGALIDAGGPVEPWFLAIAVASSMIGTSLGKLLLEKLSDEQFRIWSNRSSPPRHLLCRLRLGPDGGHRLNGLFLPRVPPGEASGGVTSHRCGCS